MTGYSVKSYCCEVPVEMFLPTSILYRGWVNGVAAAVCFWLPPLTTNVLSTSSLYFIVQLCRTYFLSLHLHFHSYTCMLDIHDGDCSLEPTIYS